MLPAILNPFGLSKRIAGCGGPQPAIGTVDLSDGLVDFQVELVGTQLGGVEDDFIVLKHAGSRAGHECAAGDALTLDGLDEVNLCAELKVKFVVRAGDMVGVGVDADEVDPAGFQFTPTSDLAWR